jgi:hypothetical protein
MKNITLTLLLILSAVSQATLANRMEDELYRSRCSAYDISAQQCAAYVELAYDNGNRCITQEEAEYASSNQLAPICSVKNTLGLFAVCGCNTESTNGRVVR